MLVVVHGGRTVESEQFKRRKVNANIGGELLLLQLVFVWIGQLENGARASYQRHAFLGRRREHRLHLGQHRRRTHSVSLQIRHRLGGQVVASVQHVRGMYLVVV